MNISMPRRNIFTIDFGNNLLITAAANASMRWTVLAIARHLAF
jgi:hypothetical protein